MENKDAMKAERQKRYYETHREAIREKQRQAYIRRVGHEPYQGKKPGRPPGSATGSYKDKWIAEGIQRGIEQASKNAQPEEEIAQ